MSAQAYGAGAGALVGAGKYFLNDKGREERQRKLAAETIRYSPWTGMSPNAVQEASLFNSTLQGASAGASLGQNMGQLTENKTSQVGAPDYGGGGGYESLPSSQIQQYQMPNISPTFGASAGKAAANKWQLMDPQAMSLGFGG